VRIGIRKRLGRSLTRPDDAGRNRERSDRGAPAGTGPVPSRRKVKETCPRSPLARGKTRPRRRSSPGGPERRGARHPAFLAPHGTSWQVLQPNPGDTADSDRVTRTVGTTRRPAEGPRARERRLTERIGRASWPGRRDRGARAARCDGQAGSKAMRQADRPVATLPSPPRAPHARFAFGRGREPLSGRDGRRVRGHRVIRPARRPRPRREPPRSARSGRRTARARWGAHTHHTLHTHHEILVVSMAEYECRRLIRGGRASR
jgi:hypothetical protein